MPKRRTAKKPLFYFEALTPWDSLAIWVYGLSTIVFIFYNYLGVDEHKVAFLIFYTVIPQLFNYLLNYTSLRNFKSFLIWCGFGLIHVVFYFLLKNDAIYKGARGFLLNTIILLFLYQVIRLISRKVQHQELAIPTRDNKDLFDNRKITFLDFILFIVYFGSFYGLVMLVVNNYY